MLDIDPQIIAEMTIISLREGKNPFVTVTSNSMAPMIRTGDELQIASAAVSDLMPGDIIALNTGDGMLAHRYWNLIQGGDTDLLLTRADSSVEFDPPFELTDYIGLIIARRRGESLLSLHEFPGRWFNRAIFQLLKFDHRFDEPKSHRQTTKFNFRDENETKESRRIVIRFSHFLVYSIVRLITLLLDIIGR